MEDSKLYNALMLIFENEEQWFNENVALDEQSMPLLNGYIDEEFEEQLQFLLDDCRYVNKQLAFAGEHWDKIKDSLVGSQWSDAYEALGELRTFFN